MSDASRKAKTTLKLMKDSLNDSEVVSQGLLKFQEGSMIESKTRAYDYSTCTYKGKISKLRRINT